MYINQAFIIFDIEITLIYRVFFCSIKGNFANTVQFWPKWDVFVSRSVASTGGLNCGNPSQVCHPQNPALLDQH